MRTMYELQVSDGKPVKPNMIVSVDAGYLIDMVEFIMVGFSQVMQNSTGSNQSIFQILYTKAFHGRCLKMPEEDII